VEKGEGLFKINKKHDKVKDQVVGHLKELAACKDSINALQSLSNLFNNNINFDYSMVQFLRIMIANYLTLNKEKEINEVSLETLLSVDNMPLQEFITLEVAEPYKEAKSTIFNIVSLVLRITINSFIFDPISELPVSFP
jgi:hypothetical protein